jgi:hypothetical protein
VGSAGRTAPSSSSRPRTEATEILAATLPVALYFGLALRNVGEWISTTEERTYSEWYRTRPSQLPAVLLFDVEHDQAAEASPGWTRYVSWARGAAVVTAPYRKVRSDAVPPAPAWCQVFQATLDDVAVAERRAAADEQAPLLDPALMPKPFFRKEEALPAPPARRGTPAPDVGPLGARVPAFCAALADSFEPRIVAHLRARTRSATGGS